MRIIHILAKLLTIFCMVSMLACGSGGGGNKISSNGQNPLKSNGLSSIINLENPLIGTWVSGEYSLTFKSDNTYVGSLNRDGSPEVWGSVIISGNVVIFSDTAGTNSPGWKDGGQIINGSYTYTINGNTLAFSPVLDLCPDSANVLCLSYQRR
jgi:hypothetical protein